MMEDGDWVALHALVHRYAVLVDARELDAVAELFTVDGELVAAAPPDSLDPVRHLSGRAGIRAGLETVRRNVATRHGVLAVAFEPGPGPGAATGTVSAVAHHLRAGDHGLVDVHWHLRYRDAYRREDGWRFARRELWIDWIESHPVDLARDIGDGTR